MFTEAKLFHKAGEGSGGGGGGDQHNLGWYATESALTTAHPTASNGDWAIVGATDTVWIWDTDTTAWVDSDQKGQVTSVNNKTGAVNLTAEDVGAVPQVSSMPTAGATELGKGYQFIGTTGTYTHGYFYECSGGNNVPTSGQLTITDYIIEPDVSPTVNVNVDTFNNYAIEHDFETLSSDNLDVSIYFTDGQIDILYNNSYTMKLYFLVNDKTSAQATLALVGITCDMTNWDIEQESAPFFVGETPTGTHYAWLMTKVQGGQQGVPDVVGGSKYLYTSGGRPYWKTVNEVPDSTGYAGAVLTTTGNGSYWGYVIPSQTGNSGKFLTTDGTDASWSDKPLVNKDTHTRGLVVGGNSDTSGTGNTVIGSNSASFGGNCNTVLGAFSQGRNGSTVIGYGIQDSISQNAVIIRSGAQYAGTVAGVSNAFCWIKGTTVYELFSADGTMPADRLASTTGLADGNYRLRLTMSNGTPTLSWVAE